MSAFFKDSILKKCTIGRGGHPLLYSQVLGLFPRVLSAAVTGRVMLTMQDRDLWVNASQGPREPTYDWSGQQLPH